MTRSKASGIFFPLLFLIAAVIIIPGRGQEQKPRRPSHSKAVDKNRFPVADYQAAEPSDPSERAKRKARGQKYDKSKWGIYPETTSNMALVDYVNPNLAGLPVRESDAVIVGQITDANAYLSNDKTGVYSVFTVELSEVLKNASQTQLLPASSVEVERDGGRVKFPTGRVLIYSISSHNMPQVGQRYVLFLSTHGNSDFQILTGYELRDGKVYPLDDLPNLYRYEDADEAAFLKELRNRITNP